jgi:hypothetical protein
MKNVTQLVAETNAWRDSYNPLRGLTIQRAVAMLENGQRGIYPDLQWAYHFVEMTDYDLIALVERRTAAVCEMDWNVKLAEHGPEEKTLADEQGAALRESYNRVTNLYGLIEHLEMSAFRGYSLAQLLRAPDRSVAGFGILDHWNVCRAGSKGAWYWNPEAREMVAVDLGEANRLDEARDELIVMESARPVDRVGLI